MRNKKMGGNGYRKEMNLGSEPPSKNSVKKRGNGDIWLWLVNPEKGKGGKRKGKEERGKT